MRTPQPQPPLKPIAVWPAVARGGASKPASVVIASVRRADVQVHAPRGGPGRRLWRTTVASAPVCQRR
eukprot:7211122-Lingulodinium_polyedra.AAC.1